MANHVRRRRLVTVGVVLLVLGGAATVLLQRQKGLDTRGATIVRERMASALLARDLEQIVVLPRGFRESDRRPLLVVLHGRSDSPAGRLNDALLEALAAAGDDAPVVLLANGGESSYYHDRENGPWASYLRDELIPATVARFSLDPDRVGYAGISMGGYGALELTRGSGRAQCGVAAIAPALWPSAAETSAGAFDDAEDFERHNVFGAVVADPAALHGTPVYLAVGERDPFHDATSAFAAALGEGTSTVVFKTGPGGHDADYFDARMREVVPWLAQRLRRC